MQSGKDSTVENVTSLNFLDANFKQVMILLLTFLIVYLNVKGDYLAYSGLALQMASVRSSGWLVVQEYHYCLLSLPIEIS